MFYHELAYRPALSQQRHSRRTLTGNPASVNVRETESQYELHLLAPGRSKEAFKISVSPDKVLHISCEVPEATEEWLHQEFKILPFKRSVKLSDGVDTTKISAAYNDGILVLSIPKTDMTGQTNLEIPVL